MMYPKVIAHTRMIPLGGTDRNLSLEIWESRDINALRLQSSQLGDDCKERKEQ